MEKYKEKVYFIGAGPGDPELITIKGQRIVKEADVIIYAGSLVQKKLSTVIKKEQKFTTQHLCLWMKL